MDLLISSAWAAPGGGPQPGLFSPILMLVIFFAVFYFLLIRPQTKRAKEHRAMVAGLNSGDEVVTNGGILGRITEVGDQFVGLEVTEGVKLKVQKHMVASVLPKGTIKNA